MLTRPSIDGAAVAYANYSHADFCAKALPKWRQELVSRFGASAEEAEECDLCMLNVWHPWGHPAFKDPLCLLDASSVSSYEETFFFCLCLMFLE